MEQFDIVLGQMIGMAVMMAVGYICVRTRVLNEAALNGICSLILKVGIPLLVFSNAVAGTTRADLIGSDAIIVMTLVMYGLLIAVFTGLSHLLRLKRERGRMFRGCFVFGNAGFIGLPLVIALFPTKGALYFALMSLVDQFLLWTYGVWTCRKVDDRQSTADEHPSRGWLDRLAPLVSPALIAVVLAVALILAGVHVPDVVLAPLQKLGGVASPLSMVYLGGLFAIRDWTGVLRRYELYVGVAVKMLAFPIGFYALLAFVPPMIGLPAANPDMVHMMTIIAGLPTMSTMVMFAERERNNPEYAIGMVLVTTVASLLTLTAVSYLVF
ncbi:AEC family transporter [Bifidobacterium saguinibicoloris]|uniref:AEC family transporter n=1 Tax=Bifidobacterium saguinibicoloris TaxID=2834433 RepID=UPI001C5A09C6|nr:AEC family transporter [Bifidobacterium saguinibicoloris]MBW3080051.1 AEC family transporter [Bifidobacterium saguinibicoloris]